MAAATDRAPALSVVIPTFNNEGVLRECLDAWERFGGGGIEIVVVEDGCRDATASLLAERSATPWGARHLRWIHQDDAHELRCTNAGMAIARGELVMHGGDMFLVAGSCPSCVTRRMRRILSLSRGSTAFRSPSD